MGGAPATFGAYEIIHRLGAGGMAETFLAVRRGPGGFEQRVCLKRILPAFESDAAFVEQFLEEARVSAQLRHANVVQVVDFGVAEGSHYLALELIEGMDLYRLLRALEERGETMTSGLVAYLANELATALDYAHSGATAHGAPVVHRDISPSNVLISRVGEVKLTDFGIARAISKSRPLTTTGTVKGKVPYMAPEYALAGRFDARGDLFALGVLLFEALAGRRPFVGATDLDTMQRIAEGRRPALAELCPSAPEALVAAIEKLLAPRPEDRFQSAAELIDALVDVQPPPTARRILGELVRRLERNTSAGAPSNEPPVRREPTSVDGPAPGLGEAPADGRWQVAGSDDATRTRAPASSDEARTVRTPTPVPPPPDVAPRRPEYTATAVGPQLAAQLLTNNGPSGATPLPVEAERLEPRPARPRLAALAGGAAVLAVLTLGALAGGVFLATRSPASVATSGPSAPPPALAPTATAPVANSPIATAPTAPSTSEPASTPAEPAEPAAPPELPVATAAPATEPPPPAGPRSRRPPTAPAIPVSAPVPVPASAPVSASASDSASASASDAAPAPASASASAPESPPPPRREEGTLEVVVMPFGEVWIDGTYVGTSPVTRSLPAGSHLVEAGPSRRERTMRRTVEVTPGRRQSVVMR